MFKTILFLIIIGASIYKEIKKSKKQAEQASEHTAPTVESEMRHQWSGMQDAQPTMQSTQATSVEDILKSLQRMQKSSSVAHQHKAQSVAPNAKPNATKAKRQNTKRPVQETMMGNKVSQQEGQRVSVDKPIVVADTTTAQPTFTIADARKAVIYDAIINRPQW